jgi:hypothetical protein
MKQLDLDTMYKKLAPTTNKPSAKPPTKEKKPASQMNLLQKSKHSGPQIIKLQKADDLLSAKATKKSVVENKNISQALP